MRRDMHKVITERPRYRSDRATVKTALKVRMYEDWDDLDVGSMRQSSGPDRVYGYQAKELNDLFGPLKRFVQSQVGRPWNKIEQEVRDSIDARTVQGRHVLDHLFQLVCVRTIEQGGKFCWAESPSGYSYLHEVGEYYVHPRTGILCRKPRRRSNR